MLHRSLINIDHADIVIADQVTATHDRKGEKDFDTNLVLYFTENIINSNMIYMKVMKDMLMSKELLQNSEEDKQDMFMPKEKEMLISEEHIPRELSHQIVQLSFEIALKSLSADHHSATIYLLSMLSAYPWEVKAGMMLSSLTIICGKIDIVSQQYHHKRLTHRLALLKHNQIGGSSYHIEKLVDDPIIITIMNLTKCVIELNPSSSSSPPQSVILACYLIAKSVLIYVQRINGIGSQSKENEESILIDKAQGILSSCRLLIEEKRVEKSYKTLLDALSNSSNNLDVLKLIFNAKDNNEIFLRHDDLKYGVERLRNERLLLIVVSVINVSVFKFFSDEFENIGMDSRIIWIPIVDDIEQWNTKNIQSHLTESMYRSSMVLDPLRTISSQFIRFVKEECSPAFQTDGEPIVISLDSHGRLVHTNALHMIFIWRSDLERDTMKVRSSDNVITLFKKELKEMTLGVDSAIKNIEEKMDHLVSDIKEKINGWKDDINAQIDESDASYNYTINREKELWDKETWSLNLLIRECMNVRGIDNKITSWISEKNDIFLYGGDDTKCVQDFATKVKEINLKAQLNIKLAYVGKSQKVRLLVENISDYALAFIEYQWFWIRLRSAFISRINYLNGVGCDERDDKIVQGLKKLLTYETNGTTIEGWVLLSAGDEVLVCDLVDQILRVINGYENWKDNDQNKSFSRSFKDYYDMLPSSSKHHHPCCALQYPTTLDPNKIPQDVKCPQCSHKMHKFLTFTCCHDHYDN